MNNIAGGSLQSLVNKPGDQQNNLKSISDIHMKSLTANNVTIKFKNKFSENRARNNYMTVNSMGRCDSNGNKARINGSESANDKYGASIERKVYNTFSSNIN